MGSFAVDLYKLYKKRLQSPEDYLAFQQFQAERVLNDFVEILDLSKDEFLVDFGCGKGGYTEVFGDHFPRVWGIDYHVEAAKESNKVEYYNRDLINLELEEKADVIFCASVIEHVEDPEALVQSIFRNLKPGGKLYISFPPFHSLGGGHQLKPIHYLPESMAIAVGKKMSMIPDTVTSYENLFGSWGLYKRSIGQVDRILKDAGFEMLKVKPRYMKFNTTKIPIIKDFLTWHVEFYCQKPK